MLPSDFEFRIFRLYKVVMCSFVKNRVTLIYRKTIPSISLMRLTKISASVTLITLLAPIATFAAWTSPGDLARIAMPLLRQTPMDLSYELHGNMDQYYAAAWVKGQSKGFDGTTSMTIDVADSNGTLRMKLEARMKDETLYLMIKSIEGKYEHELGSLTANVTGKKWIKMPLTQSEVLSSDEDMAAVLDEMFTLSESTTNGVTSHQLTLKREIVKERMRQRDRMRMREIEKEREKEEER